MKTIIYSKPSGMVVEVVPALNVNDPPEFTEDDAVSRALTKLDLRAATNVAIVERSTLPADRTFRSAWRWDGVEMTIDLTVAREKQARRIVQAIETELSKLKTKELVARALGNATTAAQAVARRQALDATDVAAPLISAADADAIKAVWPTGLARP